MNTLTELCYIRYIGLEDLHIPSFDVVSYRVYGHNLPRSYPRPLEVLPYSYDHRLSL